MAVQPPYDNYCAKIDEQISPMNFPVPFQKNECLKKLFALKITFLIFITIIKWKGYD